MKSLQWIVVLTVVTVSCPALAAEKYEASVVARGNKGFDFTYRFALEIDKLTTGQFGGQISSWDSKICASARAIKGELKPNGEVTFATDTSPIKGCGKMNFTGKREGDTAIIGKMNYQGEMHNFNFKKLP